MILCTSYKEENQSQSNSAKTNKQHQPEDALSMFLSRQHFAETQVCGCEQKMSSFLAFPLIFIALGEAACFHTSKGLLFSHAQYIWLLSSKQPGKNAGLETNSSGKCK